MKSFFIPVLKPCLVSFCPLSSKRDTSIPSLVCSQDSPELLPCRKRSAHTLASGASGMVIYVVPEPPELSPSIFQNNLIFNLAQDSFSFSNCATNQMLQRPNLALLAQKISLQTVGRVRFRGIHPNLNAETQQV